MLATLNLKVGSILNMTRCLTLMLYRKNQRKPIYVTKILLKQSEISTDRATFT